MFNGHEMVLANIPEKIPNDPELMGGVLDSAFELVGDGIGWTAEKVVGGFFSLLGEGFKFMGEWIITHLPEIMGYGTIGFGALMILASMTKGSIMKPFAWWSGLMIIAIALLGG